MSEESDSISLGSLLCCVAGIVALMRAVSSLSCAMRARMRAASASGGMPNASRCFVGVSGESESISLGSLL